MDAKEAKIYIAVIITVLVIGVIIFYFAVSIVRQQRKVMDLQRANILAEISAMERERARIAADLHDDVGPILSVIKFEVDSVHAVNEADQKELEKASEFLDGLIGRMRGIANNLMPSALYRKGLVAAIEEFINNMKQPGGMEIRLNVHEVPLLAEEKNINIYRSVQEVIHNSLKHGKATVLEIKMEQKGKVLEILCRDNGAGFDYERLLREGNGLGLRSIKYRTEIMGGSLTVESKLDVGTAYLFEVPI